jgi:hypothetical protein
MPDGARRLVFAYDIEGYGKRDPRQADAAQRRLVDLLSRALDAAGVAPGGYERQGEGDGGITLLGYTGDSVVAACRLRDAAVVKRLLAASSGDLIVVVPDHLHRDLRAEAGGRSFTQVSVTAKEYSATAWVYLPGGVAPAAPGAQGPSAPGTQERAAPLLSDALKTNPGLW